MGGNQRSVRHEPFVLHERLLAQHALSIVPPSIGVKGDGYFGGDAPTGGRSIRLSMREGMDLLAHDVRVLTDAEREVLTDPCLAVTLLLDGCGSGRLIDPETGTGLAEPIQYTPSTLYLSFTTRALIGRSFAPVNTRYRLVELRLAHDLLERLGLETTLLELRPSLATHCASGAGYWVGMVAATPSLVVLAEQLHRAALDGTANDLTLDARGLDLLVGAIELITGTTMQNAPTVPARLRNRIEAAAKMLEAEPASPWTIQRLARAVGLGEKNLKRGFRDCFSTTAMGYLLQRRLELGRRLLEESEESITEISLHVGYANPSHFARLYRRRYGESPHETRRHSRPD